MSANPEFHQECEPDSYPILRQILAPEYASLPAEHLEAVIERTFGPVLSATEYEEIFGGIGRAFNSVGRDLGRAASSVGRGVGQAAKTVAPIAQNVLPGIVQGAMAGSALGPYGMLAGAVAGGAGAALSKYGRGDVKTAGNILSGVVGTAGALGGGGLGGLGALGKVAGGFGGSQGGVGAGLGALGSLVGGADQRWARVGSCLRLGWPRFWTRRV